MKLLSTVLAAYTVIPATAAVSRPLTTGLCSLASPLVRNNLPSVPSLIEFSTSYMPPLPSRPSDSVSCPIPGINFNLPEVCATPGVATRFIAEESHLPEPAPHKVAAQTPDSEKSSVPETVLPLSVTVYRHSASEQVESITALYNKFSNIFCNTSTVVNIPEDE
jgi:hypothetical protein